jgi:hypothetical protein
MTPDPDGDPGLPVVLPIPDGWMNVPEEIDEDSYEFDPDRIMREDCADASELAAWLAAEGSVQRVVDQEHERETGERHEPFDFDASIDDSGEPR